MAPQEIHKFWKRRPFMPFRLDVVDGTSWQVLDPSDIYVDMLNVSVGIEADEAGLFKRSIYISPSHVSRIEPLPDKAESDTNGRR